MSLTSMLRSSLGVGTDHGHMTMHGDRVADRVFQALGNAGGTAITAYLNGRMPTNGKDYLEVSFGGKSAPLDLAVLVGGHLMGLLDVGGYGNVAHDIANGAQGTYLSRVFTRYGSEARIKSAAKQIASGSFDNVTPIGGNKFAMRG